MMTTTTTSRPTDRLGFRPSVEDMRRIAIIADKLRDQGKAFVSRSDCLRLALETTAGAMLGNGSR